MADETAFLVGEETAAVGALSGYIPGRTVLLRDIDGFTAAVIAAIGISFCVFFKDHSNGVGAGKDSFAMFPGN